MIYRKLREYINTEYDNIFGTLKSNHCIYTYTDEKGETQNYHYTNFYDDKKYDFLLDYYVISILPVLKTVDNIFYGPEKQVFALLNIVLAKEI